jgi:hypothetical protein
VRGALEFTHYEAQMARLSAGSAGAVANTSAVLGAQAVELLKALQLGSRPDTPAITSAQLAEALRLVFAPLVGGVR